MSVSTGKDTVRKGVLKDVKSKSQVPVVKGESSGKDTESPTLFVEPLMGTPVKSPPSKSARVSSPSLVPSLGLGGAGGSEAAVAGGSAAAADVFAGISSASNSELAARSMDLDEMDDDGEGDGLAGPRLEKESGRFVFGICCLS